MPNLPEFAVVRIIALGSSTEQPHDLLEVGARWGVVEVARVVGVAGALAEQVMRAPALRASGVEVDSAGLVPQGRDVSAGGRRPVACVSTQRAPV
jgi:hypothetical protein